MYLLGKKYCKKTLIAKKISQQICTNQKLKKTEIFEIN